MLKSLLESGVEELLVAYPFLFECISQRVSGHRLLIHLDNLRKSFWLKTQNQSIDLGKLLSPGSFF